MNRLMRAVLYVPMLLIRIALMVAFAVFAGIAVCDFVLSAARSKWR
jgi:hypothetical protein